MDVTLMKNTYNNNDFWCLMPLSVIFQVFVVEEAGVPGENHRPWANNR
jgi:hypothetical protein